MQSYINIQYTVWCKKWDPRCSHISIFSIQCGAKQWDPLVPKFLYEGVPLFLRHPVYIYHSCFCVHSPNQLPRFQSLHNDVADHRGNFDFLTQTGQQLLLKMPPGDKSKNVRLELDNLSSRWALVGSTIEELVTKHELAIDGLKQYKV